VTGAVVRRLLLTIAFVVASPTGYAACQSEMRILADELAGDSASASVVFHHRDTEAQRKAKTEKKPRKKRHSRHGACLVGNG
jgi:hypothetical protein